MEFEKNDLVDMIFLLGECQKNCLLASRVYKERFPNKLRHPREESFRILLERFERTGNVSYEKQERAKPVTHEENEVMIMTAIVENPHTSSRQLSTNLDISRTSIQRIIKKHKFHPYHIQLHQELLDADYQKRLTFCQWIQNQLAVQVNFLQRIMFSDEATFHKNGTVNKHNFHYYSDHNPHIMMTTGSQHKWSLNVWAGILDGYLIGPYFFENILNGALYYEFLSTQLFDLLQDVPVHIVEEMWFQQDGAPPHFAVNVKEWLNQQFPGRWIGRGSAINWPARSPDLTPLDFFLWGYVKEIVYKEVPTTKDNMKMRIRNAFASITPAMLRQMFGTARKTF